MLEAIILNGQNTLVCDLPQDPLELQNKLNSIRNKRNPEVVICEKN